MVRKGSTVRVRQSALRNSVEFRGFWGAGGATAVFGSALWKLFGSLRGNPWRVGATGARPKPRVLRVGLVLVVVRRGELTPLGRGVAGEDGLLFVSELPSNPGSIHSRFGRGLEARGQTGSTATGTAGCSAVVDVSRRSQGAVPTSRMRSSARVGTWCALTKGLIDERRVGAASKARRSPAVAAATWRVYCRASPAPAQRRR